MRSVAAFVSAALAAALLGALPGCRACKSASDESPAMPRGLRVPVDRDGAALVAIDQALLDRTKPDFVDGDRKAWRLASLLVPGSLDAHAVEIEDVDGVRTVFARSSDIAAGRELVITVNRAGGLRVALTSDEDVFAAFHGRGGNRGRAGDPTRVREVRHIYLASEG
jgi:hypothetical protein